MLRGKINNVLFDNHDVSRTRRITYFKLLLMDKKPEQFLLSQRTSKLMEMFIPGNKLVMELLTEEYNVYINIRGFLITLLHKEDPDYGIIFTDDMFYKVVYDSEYAYNQGLIGNGVIFADIYTIDTGTSFVFTYLSNYENRIQKTGNNTILELNVTAITPEAVRVTNVGEAYTFPMFKIDIFYD